MRKFLVLSFALITLAGISCSSQTNPKPAPSVSKNSDVEVYYFHMTVRCTTCKTVEAEARKNVEMLYPEQYKSGKISFTSLNIEEPSGKAAGERLGVNIQTLLIVKGDQKINLTNEGFLYAVTKPDKFRDIIKEKIDSLIK
jgi:hypothetical protein